MMTNHFFNITTEVIMKHSKLIAISFLICGLFLFIACEQDESAAAPAEEEKVEAMTMLPAPQLVTNARMFIAGFKIDPKVAKALLPEGLEPHPNSMAVISMYTVPHDKHTSGLGAYTLTYITIEVANHEAYTMVEPTGLPGRYYVHYFNSSPILREFTSRIGIPAEPGTTTVTVDDEGNLKAVLEVNGKPFITSTAKVGSESGEVIGGHHNYLGLITGKEGDKTRQFVVKYPVPYTGAKVTAENPTIKISAPPGHPLNKLTPKLIDWAVWFEGSFVYPNPVVVHEIKQ